jgi:hypothetical protein
MPAPLLRVDHAQVKNFVYSPPPGVELPPPCPIFRAVGASFGAPSFFAVAAVARYRARCLRQRTRRGCAGDASFAAEAALARRSRRLTVRTRQKVREVSREARVRGTYPRASAYPRSASGGADRVA